MLHSVALLSSFRCSTLCATLRSHPPVASVSGWFGDRTTSIYSPGLDHMDFSGPNDHCCFPLGLSSTICLVVLIAIVTQWNKQPFSHALGVVYPSQLKVARSHLSLDKIIYLELQGCWTSIIFIKVPPSSKISQNETLHSLSCECKSSWSPPAPLVYAAAATVGELLPFAWWNNFFQFQTP